MDPLFRYSSISVSIQGWHVRHTYGRAVNSPHDRTCDLVLNLVPGIVSGTKLERTWIHQTCGEFTARPHVWCGVPVCKRDWERKISNKLRKLFFLYEDAEEEVLISPFYENSFVVIESILSWTYVEHSLGGSFPFFVGIGKFYEILPIWTLVHIAARKTKSQRILTSCSNSFVGVL